MHGITGKTFSVVALGCRTNQYEAEAIVSMLDRRGAVFLPSPSDSPDIIVLLTCSVTSVADAKTRKLLRRTRRGNPFSAVVACGCSVQELTAEEVRRLGVDILVGNRMKHEIPDALENWFDARESNGNGKAFFDLRCSDIGRNTTWDSLYLDRPRLRTRAFVKVQDGCSRACSYCIVPRVRGAETSRSSREVLCEISDIVGSGCVEVILTGVHLGGYRDGASSLAGLMDSVSSIKGLRRLRLGSLEPFAVSDDLLRALRDSSIFCPHLHLPIQSGDDGVLFRMRRGYDSSGFRRTIDRVRGALGENVHISTDLIVGFPGETDEAFERSLSVIRDIGFGKVHVFPFSPRRGTDAARMVKVLPSVVRARVAMATELSADMLSHYASRQVGVPDTVLVEEEKNGVVSGWSSHYLRVYVVSGGDDIEGNEIFVDPKKENKGILLCKGVASDALRNFSTE